MLTPRFIASQTSETLVLTIYIPSVRASEIELSTPTPTRLNLHVNPYFLRLTFPHPVVDVDSVDPYNASSAKYDPSSGILTLTLYKQIPGSDFGDLSMISRLMAVDESLKKGYTPSIEVVDSKEENGSQSREDDNIKTSENPMEPLRTEMGKLDLKRERAVLLEAEKNNWVLPQNLDITPGPSFDSTFTTTSSSCRPYGFLDMHSGYFRHASSAYSDNEANELGPDVEQLAPVERRAKGKQKVDAKFDGSYYLADYVNDEEISDIIKWKHPYPDNGSDIEFTEDEKLAMINLPRKEYIPTLEQTRTLYLTLVSLLLSSAYDTRTTQSDPTAESPWTLTVLTPAFAALSPPLSTWKTAEVLIEFYKRALSYPLYRHWGLCERCKADVVNILKGGRRSILRVLLKMNHLLKAHDAYYVYGKIWLEDFCVWLQKGASDETLRTLADEVHNSRVEKSMLGWDLDELEIAAQEVMEEPPDSDDEDESDEMENMTPSIL
ncbi:hypothetical protein Clacol_006161 [Clathrus columnatus]|uniref:CS domain-containing protein n=1 Tax=Clathrus columnatus TaxID=1419009 RepID=A0AAV5AGV7_9AGAM|nr:hypothetical protein Clacol_006161 [Clathrus columnatus]